MPCLRVAVTQSFVCLEEAAGNGYNTMLTLQDFLWTGTDVTFPVWTLDFTSALQAVDFRFSTFKVVALQVFQSTEFRTPIAIVTVWTENDLVPHNVTNVNSLYHVIYGHVPALVLAVDFFLRAALEDAHAAEDVRRRVLEHILGEHPAFGAQAPQ